MAAIPDKDTIYIDIDDEITAIIDKVKASNSKIVALVLPKRASVLQSIVNMKLLKRSADNDKKNLVLVTSEAGLLPLAGTVGLYVAKTPQSKPEIPSVAPTDDDAITDGDIDDDTPEEFTAANAADRPVGELAAASGAGAIAVAAKPEAIETLQLDDDLEDDTVDDKSAAAAAKPPKEKKNRKLAVPNFDRFRVLLALGGLGLIALVVFIYLALAVLPKATITITTDTSDVNSNLTLNLDTAAKTLDTTKLTVPATAQQLQKTGSQQASATGKKNNGDKATGTVQFYNCNKDDTLSGTNYTVPAGTGITYNGLTYITQEPATVTPSHYLGSTCKKDQLSSPTDVKAQVGGANYNTSASTTYGVAGFSTINAVGDSMTGGTDNNVQVVSQADIDGATQKLTAQNGDAIKQQLQQQLQQNGLFAITATFAAGTPAVTPSAKVGDQVSTVTVTETTSYTMFGVKKADLKTLVDNDVKGHIDASKQSILDEGLGSATFRLNSATATTAQLAMSTTATAGPDLKTDTIKSQSAGKKAGDIKSQLKSDPGVTAVDVKFSPFWVNKAPSKSSKLTVTFVKSNGK